MTKIIGRILSQTKNKFMSKSNVEKQRLAKIRAFKNGECEFDVSMIKLKNSNTMINGSQQLLKNIEQI